MAIDSGVSINVIDQDRFQKIRGKSRKRITLEKSKIRIYGYASEKRIPVAGQFTSVVETQNKEIPATFIVVKGILKIVDIRQEEEGSGHTVREIIN